MAVVSKTEWPQTRKTSVCDRSLWCRYKCWINCDAVGRSKLDCSVVILDLLQRKSSETCSKMVTTAINKKRFRFKMVPKIDNDVDERIPRFWWLTVMEKGERIGEFCSYFWDSLEIFWTRNDVTHWFKSFSLFCTFWLGSFLCRGPTHALRTRAQSDDGFIPKAIRPLTGSEVQAEVSRK